MYICIKLLNRPYYGLYNVFFTNFTDVLNYMLMKIRHLKVSALLLAATLLTSSCVGSFSLFNRVAKWNTHATSSKFLNEIIFILISPPYAVCAVADDDFYKRLIAFAKKYNIIVIHDNAYSDIIYDGKTGRSILSFDGAKEVAVEFYSLSKSLVNILMIN